MNSTLLSAEGSNYLVGECQIFCPLYSNECSFKHGSSCHVPVGKVNAATKFYFDADFYN